MEERVPHEPGRKRKKLSKNKKKNWRKTDIKDIEDHLEDIRVQERTGGLVADKPDEQLFFFDTEQGQDTVLPKTRKRARKPLKCHALLEPDPKIKPFKIPHNVPKPETQLKRRSNRVACKRKSLKVTAQTETRKKNTGQEVICTDLWGGTQTGVTPTNEFHMKYTRKANIKAPKSVGTKTSAVEAVEVPHPGQSYNPEYRAHQTLLQTALDVEVKQLKEDLRVKRALDDMFPKAADAPTQESWLTEMSAGLADGDENTSSHVTEEEGAELLKLSVNPAVRREDKKTEKQRRKEQERKAKEKLKQSAKSERVKRTEIFRLKSIKRELNARETRLKQRSIRKAVRKLDQKDQPKKLGKLKYSEASIPLKLSDELEGSLRLLKPEGNLIEDRYKSLQKRNMIEPRTRAKKVRKYKVKRVEKKSHKEVTL